MTHTDPIRCFKADIHSTVCVILRVPNLPGDNPQQSEEASHMGGNASRKSQKSMKGGPPEVTESDGGYHEPLHGSFFLYQILNPYSWHYVIIIQWGQPRSAAATRAEIYKQVQLAMWGYSEPVKKLQTATGTKDKITQHWIEIHLAKARRWKLRILVTLLMKMQKILQSGAMSSQVTR